MGRSTKQLLKTTPSSLSGSQRLDSVLAYQWFGLDGPISLSADSLPLSFLPAHRALTMSPEQFQYIWRKTIPHIEVGMGSGVFTSHRSARFALIGD